jgi:glucose-6-phosphate 1-dehydrogenase
MANVPVVNRENEYEQPGKVAGPCVMVVFGAAGDLTKRKLVPALFNLAKARLLSNDFAIVGVSVDDLSLDQFRNQATGFLQAEDRETEVWERFTQRGLRGFEHVFRSRQSAERFGSGAPYGRKLFVLSGDRA